MDTMKQKHTDTLQKLSVNMHRRRLEVFVWLFFNKTLRSLCLKMFVDEPFKKEVPALRRLTEEFRPAGASQSFY